MGKFYNNLSEGEDMRNIFFILLLVSLSFAFIACDQMEPMVEKDTQPAKEEVQTWFKVFGTDVGLEEGYCVIETSDGFYVAVGTTTGYSMNTMELDPDFRNDIFLVKVDKEGNRIWQKAVIRPGNEQGWSVIESSDGNYVVAGNTNVNGGSDIYLAKFKPSGEKIWERTLGDAFRGEWGFGLAETADGGFLVAGNRGGGLTYMESSVGFYFKTNSEGHMIWVKEEKMTNNHHLHFNSIAPTSDGNFILAGSMTDIFYDTDLMVIQKITPAGEKIWRRNYTPDSIAFFLGYNIRQTPDGGFIFAGGWNFFGILGGDMWPVLMKISANGEKAFIYPYDGEFEGWTNRGVCVEAAEDGSYVMATKRGGSIHLEKVNPDGTVNWKKNYLLGDSSGANWITKTSDGGYIITGYYGSWMKALVLLKTDSSGNVENIATDE